MTAEMPSYLRRYIVHVPDLMNVKEEESKQELNLCNFFQTKNLAARVVKLKPGGRSSLPHAESHEEELFYVLQGEPSVWLDGLTYQLKEGHVVGFPAGEGLCHTVINDSREDVLILSLGERTKKENTWIFPLHPEQHERQKSGKWESWPQRTLGDHPGTAGTGINALPPKHSNIVFAPEVEKLPVFSYTGDTETFGVCKRVTDALKLKAIGFGLESLEAGKRSSWPHCHSHEEEYIYILKGHPQVWLNGWVETLSPGDFVYFEPGSHISHVLLNTTSERVDYLVWGQTMELCPDDKIYYPFHPRRNEECRGKGFLWENYEAPKETGPYTGKII